MTEFRDTQWQVGESSIHVVEAGDPGRPPILFLHGWPQSWRCWREVMALGADQAHLVAIDLPGIGASTGASPTRKRQMAAVVGELIEAMGLEQVTLVGHDVGGAVAFFAAHDNPDLARVVLVNTGVPGVEPWDDVITNPFVWHIAFHATPALPETLVRGREREYLDHFFDLLSPDPRAITDEARAEYVAAYRTESALSTGFGWYRAFGGDARDVTGVDGVVRTPVLLLHGEHEFGDVEAQARGLRGTGMASLAHGVVPGAGHFAQEDAPAAVWRAIAEFAL